MSYSWCPQQGTFQYKRRSMRYKRVNIQVDTARDKSVGGDYFVFRCPDKAFSSRVLIYHALTLPRRL